MDKKSNMEMYLLDMEFPNWNQQYTLLDRGEAYGYFCTLYVWWYWKKSSLIKMYRIPHFNQTLH